MDITGRRADYKVMSDSVAEKKPTISNIDPWHWTPPKQNLVRRLGVTSAVIWAGVFGVTNTWGVKHGVWSLENLAQSAEFAAMWCAATAGLNSNSVQRFGMRRAARRLRKLVEKRDAAPVAPLDSPQRSFFRGYRNMRIRVAAGRIRDLDSGNGKRPAAVRNVQYRDGKVISIANQTAAFSPQLVA